MSKAVQEIFDHIAPRYDLINRTLSLSIDKRWRARMLKELRGREWPVILDLCAGTLDLSQRLAQRFPKSHILALDFSLPMLQHGGAKIVQAPRVKRLCADGHRLPLYDSSVDAMVCAFGIRNLDQREIAAAEIRRVLKHQGKLVVLEFFRPEGRLARWFYQSYGRIVIPQLGGWLSRQKAAYQYLQDSIQGFYSLSEYVALLKRHGFSQVRHFSLSGGIVHCVIAD